MNLGTAVVLLIVIGICGLALRSVLKKRGGCGCGGGEGCSSCSSTKVYGINDSCTCPHSADAACSSCNGCAAKR